MINASQVKPNTPVVCSNNVQFAVADHMEGANWIKLNKDDKGVHHYIPLSWVTKVDSTIHVDRPGDQALREAKTSVPTDTSDAKGKTNGKASAADKSGPTSASSAK